MKLAITSDIPGRIRFRYGRDFFTTDFETAVEEYFLAINGVTDARACHITGSVLVCYSPDCRQPIVAAAKKLSFPLSPPFPVITAMSCG